MTPFAMAAVYATATTITFAFARTVPGIFGSFVIRRSLIFASAISFFALVPSLLTANQILPNYLDVVIFWLWFPVFLHTFGFGVLLRLYVRSTHFKDYGTYKNMRAVPPVRIVRSQFRRVFLGDRETYETAPLPPTLQAERKELLEPIIGRQSHRSLLLLTGKEPDLVRQLAVKVSATLLLAESSHDVNYVCCTISPDDVWTMFKAHIPESRINESKSRLVIIDAYTNTYGFRDEVLHERVRRLSVDQNVNIVSNANSSASIHSATAKAFHILKDAAGASRAGGRRPCIMIYDCLSAFAMTETESELAQFVVHLTAAEQAYDMYTVFVEPEMEVRQGLVLESMRTCCGAPLDVDKQNLVGDPN